LTLPGIDEIVGLIITAYLGLSIWYQKKRYEEMGNIKKDISKIEPQMKHYVSEELDRHKEIIDIKLSHIEEKIDKLEG
jgi:hypothetical protein